MSSTNLIFALILLQVMSSAALSCSSCEDCIRTNQSVIACEEGVTQCFTYFHNLNFTIKGCYSPKQISRSSCNPSSQNCNLCNTSLCNYDKNQEKNLLYCWKCNSTAGKCNKNIEICPENVEKCYTLQRENEVLEQGCNDITLTQSGIRSSYKTCNRNLCNKVGIKKARERRGQNTEEEDDDDDSEKTEITKQKNPEERKGNTEEVKANKPSLIKEYPKNSKAVLICYQCIGEACEETHQWEPQICKKSKSQRSCISLHDTHGLNYKGCDASDNSLKELCKISLGHGGYCKLCFTSYCNSASGIDSSSWKVLSFVVVAMHILQLI